MPYFTIIIINQCLILQNYYLQNALFYNMYLSVTTLDSHLFFIRCHDCIPFCCLAVVIYPVFQGRINNRNF